jgi:hypothetical protein
MKKKHLTRKSPDPSHPWTQRLIELWKRVWEGNKSKMGVSLGVSNQVIMRILAGQQLPTGKVLEAIAAHPEINMRWLLTGEGEPLIEPGARSGAGPLRPIVDDLLPGLLEDHPNYLTGLSYPVADGFDSTTSYWYRVPAASPLINKEPVRAGDLLFMETDAKWTRNANALAGKYIGFLVRTKKGTKVFFGKVDITAEFDSYFESDLPESANVETFGEFKASCLVVPNSLQEEKKRQPRSEGEASSHSVPQPAKHDKEITLGLENVVCVCLQLARSFHKKRIGNG